MALTDTDTRRKFRITLIKPSHYDREGYVIQWWKAWIPSNSMACLYGIALDAADRKVLGKDVDIEIDAYDEMNIKVPVKQIVRRMKEPGTRGLVCMVGVQSNQYPRALELARKFRAQDVDVAIGGFHVSGVIAMINELTPELKEAVDLGITLYAGEAEEHFVSFLQDIHKGEAKPVYNYMHDLPNLQGVTTPYLPERLVKRYDGVLSSFDAGRGCPFQCSFCTIINVQGRKSRWRDADDIEHIIKKNAAQRVFRFFITDDNFARNKNWEAIFDRLAHLREVEGYNFGFLIQIDTLAHKIPNFIDKAKRAGCTFVFIGLESINPENLVHMKKGQNRITEYRKMFQLWKEAGIVTYAGFITGLPGDTPETIRRDVEIVQRELAVDLLEFTMLTPLPGSEDHQVNYNNGTWMDPDLNKYDIENATVEHPKMSREVWQQTYKDVWRWYYSDEHVATMMRRNLAWGIKPVKIWRTVLQIYGANAFEDVHPQQCGYFRRRSRTDRRPELRRLTMLEFYPWHAFTTLVKYLKFGAYAWKINRIRKRVQRDPASKSYSDFAMTAAAEGEEEKLEMFQLNDASRKAVERAKKLAETIRHSHHHDEAPADAAE